MLNDTNKPILLIVIPCYNEEEALPETAEKLSGKISQLVSDEIISQKSALLFVDDGSTDNTWALIEKYQRGNPQMFKGIKLSENCGHQRALLCGLVFAKDYADVTISIDADLQDDIDAIDAMLEKFIVGADIVYGVRLNRQSDSFFKKISAGLFYRVMRFLAADIIHNHADFRLMTRKAIEALAEYSGTLFLRGIVPRLGFKSDIVYYDRKKRSLGKSKYNLQKMLKLALDGIVSLRIVRKKQMPDKKNLELRLTEIIHSEKTKKTAIFLVYAGIVVCILPLLLPVQKLLFSFVDDNTSRLLSLFFVALFVFIFALCCLYAKNISRFIEDARNTRLISVLAIVVLLVTLVFSGIFSYCYGWHWLDSDHSSEMVLGKLLAEENALASTNWLYSNEIRLVYQTIFTMPLFKLLGRHENWALIRSLNIVLNNLALVLAFVFLMKQLKIKTKWILISSLFLIMPLSYDYWTFVLFGGYYTFFIAQLFCCLGFYVRLCHSAAEARSMWAELILFSILSFVLGLQGLRSLLNVYIPLLITCVYIWSKTAQKKHVPLFLGCYGFLVCCVGYAANHLLHRWYSFVSFENMLTENLLANFFSKLSRSLANLVGFFGFSGRNEFLSAQGLFSIMAVIGTFVLLRAVCTRCRKAHLQSEDNFMPVFFAISVIFNIFIFVTVSQVVISRYFIPFMILYVPLTAILFEYAEKAYGYVKRAACICGIVLFITGQGYLSFQSLATRNLNTSRKGYVQYLLDNAFEYGFATYWNANITAELSNGKVELAGLDPRIQSGAGENMFRFFGYLNPVKFFDPLYHTGESFLLLARNEWDIVRGARLFSALQPAYQDSNYVIIRFPSAEIIYRELLEKPDGSLY